LDVVQDHLAVWAEHLGETADDRQQRLQARIERVSKQNDPPAFVVVLPG